MELVITSQELEPLPARVDTTEFVRPEGLLNSNYKSVVKCNLSNTKSNSIFGIKQRVKSRQYQFTSSIATLLKLSVFVAALVFII
ncbi:hypothetical protein [Psychroserpens sp.]|uniref:hypothetical protein n=1 Tax=Psychroserpens sp. TaxID=2020870 RepID=UPI001B25D424|nr:hypothetical protein [Psychroserpens sp.]MBO6605893.1 hypothetical protein [Psychroserpens sp.]MBO6631896.1 hypothetical protein [Psychroserpens sp.]MBO6652736.1 hypothetical protein [Psychroserpens sp.]MBO6681492.1 hypothetical protein [Psychroserpens sp.]MBO6749267.1 hypothetical protein [Psychroserpens sp.]